MKAASPLFASTFLLLLNAVFGEGETDIEERKRPSVVLNCDHDDHCDDFRMVCIEENRLCVCAKFYDWDESLGQCHLNLAELGLWLSNMKEEKDMKDKTYAEANRVFSRVAWSGILVLLCGVLGGMVCIISFCIKTRGPEGEELLIKPGKGGGGAVSREEEERKNMAAGDAGLTNILFIQA